MLSAADLYALANGCKNTGPLHCHWCGSACTDLLPHNDLPYLPFVRSGIPAKYPGNSYTCVGCWNWQRKRVTINYLAGGFRDGQTPCKHSWLITETNAWSVHSTDYAKLLDFLLAPTGSFALALVDGPTPPDNRIQLAVANNLAEINADTPMYFTVNNVPFRYTVYEVEDAVRNNQEGKDAGVRYLLGLHRPYIPPLPNDRRAEKRTKSGRPRIEEKEDDGRAAKRVVHRSGGIEEWIVRSPV